MFQHILETATSAPSKEKTNKKTADDEHNKTEIFEEVPDINVNNTKQENNKPPSTTIKPSEPSEPSAREGASANTINGRDKDEDDDDIDQGPKEIMKCFYCDQSYESDIKRVKHIDDEHPDRLHYPNPEDFENRNLR